MHYLFGMPEIKSLQSYRTQKQLHHHHFFTLHLLIVVMAHKQENSEPTEHQFQLILVDDSLIQRTFSHLPDLYLQLVKEPSFFKKQSFKYDYQPAPLLYSNEDHHFDHYQQVENAPQNVNVNKGIKCNCCKTKCQKNYCQCFKAGVICGSDCSCTECSNNGITLNSLPKRNSGTGCKCQKSHCLKNYCECHNGGRKCSEECRCLDCHNMENKDSSQQKELFDLSKPKKKVKRYKTVSITLENVERNANQSV